MGFFVRELNNCDIKQELNNIGFDKSYIYKACDKFNYINIKIFSLNIAQANILKQTALSLGADCATHHDTITAKIDKTDCILGGSFNQIKKIAEKLSLQPFNLKELGQNILNLLESSQTTTKTKIVGILNLSKESFSDGFENYEDAIKHLEEIIEADIIELGAESTKPYSKAIPSEIQIQKIMPVLNYLTSNYPNKPISIDTRSAKVAQECLKSGATIINDVSGLDFDKGMTSIISKQNCKVVIQHSSATPDIMQDNTNYTNLIDDIFMNLKAKTDFAIKNGINKDNIIIDVGIGFGKTIEQNFELLKRIKEFKSLGYPIMVGISRKSLLQIPQEDNLTKDIYTLALNSVLIDKQVDYIRVHNVKLHKKFLELYN